MISSIPVMRASVGRPNARSWLLRNVAIHSRAWSMSMLVYIDTASNINK
jgi:hypothetical protein